jgi:RNA polymerase sigma factor (sigma-70 family)
VSVRARGHARQEEARDIATANYEALKEEVLRAVAGRLRAEGARSIVRPDLEDAYNQGWHGVCRHIEQGKPLTSLDGLLYTITLRRALDIYRQRRDATLIDTDLERHGAAPDLAEQIDDQQKLNRLLERLKNRLSDKERRAVTLCVLHGYTRPEAADLLGVDRVVFERIMDGATKKMSGIVAAIQARGCGDEEWSRLMRDYALGLISEHDREHSRAENHVEGPEACESCRRYVRGLQGLAAILPPLMPVGPLESLARELLAHVYKLFGAGHGAATASAPTVQTSVTAAGATTIGSVGTSGGGVAGLVGGGTLKTIVVLAGIAAASTVSVQSPINRHAHPGRAHLTARDSKSQPRRPQFQTGATVTARLGDSGASNYSNGPATGRPQVASPRQTSQVAAEFGIESSRQSTTTLRAQRTSVHRPPVASAASTTPLRERARPSAEFGVVGTTGARPSQQTSSAEFGFERSGNSG